MKISSLTVVLIWVSSAFASHDLRRVHRRQGGLFPPPAATTSTTPGSTAPTTTPATTTPPSNTTPAATTPATTPQITKESSVATTTTPLPPKTTAPTIIPVPPKATTRVTTDDGGNTVTTVDTITATAIPTPTATEAPVEPPKPVPQQTIIALAVSGGVAGLGLIAFIVWKLNQKRFSQFDDEDDTTAIKWPDAQPDPAAAAGGGGALGRTQSEVFSQSTAANSNAELDPYGVPPLPQNQYHDDPNIAAGGYYDPYRGPVPNTFSSPPESRDGHGQAWTGPGEAIPMSTYPPPGRRPSPGPSMAYDDGYRRGSPAPYGVPPVMDRRSPGPALGYGQPVDVYGRGPSPAPPPPQHYADPYAGGRASPAMGGRRSPGPNIVYDDPYGGVQR